VTLTILSHGVDSLYLTFQGAVEPALLDALESLKSEAQATSRPAPIFFEDGRAMVVLPSGNGFYRYTIHCTDFDVFVARGEHVPPVYVRLSSLYLHSVGALEAAGEVRGFVAACLAASNAEPTTSRIDVYADFQGWQPRPDDLDRFVTRSVRNHAYYEPAEEAHRGLRLTGFRFGKDQLVARLYDKTAEIEQGGKHWMRDVWGDRLDPNRPVWRLEYQFRREAIADFNLRGVDEVLSCLSDLWRYGLEWLSLRERTFDRQRGHWPVALEWRALAHAEPSAPLSGVLRRRWRERQELLIIRGLAGYLTSFAALRGHLQAPEALAAAGRAVTGHLAHHGRSFTQSSKPNNFKTSEQRRQPPWSHC
jgi:hypothetical protein